MENKKEITIYTDGACLGNPGAGGWCALILMNKKEKILSGGSKDTTNNRMEMFAVIEALRVITNETTINLFTDSKYIINGISLWIKNWKINNWRTSNNKPVKNYELWKKIDFYNDNLKINWHWVKGHSGNEYNDKVDKIAQGEAVKFK
tara:strand:- start:638 stop:1081 length:444 start_codon:yes stop_codon:yes gene_type:complete